MAPTISSHIGLNLFHIFVVFPLFFYVAFMRGLAPPWVYQALLGLGIVILIYHLYKTIVKWRANSLSVWVNIIHILFVAPLMIYIGKNAYDTPRWAFELLAMLSFSAVGYHLYNLIIDVQNIEVRGPSTGTSTSTGSQKGGYVNFTQQSQMLLQKAAQAHHGQPFA